MLRNEVYGLRGMGICAKTQPTLLQKILVSGYPSLCICIKYKVLYFFTFLDDITWKIGVGLAVGILILLLAGLLLFIRMKCFQKK